MGTNNLRGTLLAQKQRMTFRFDPTRGETVITDYAGLGYEQMFEIANLYAYNGVAYDMVLEKGVARLVANDATLNNPIDNWELVGNDERRDLFLNPAWANQISDDQMAAIRSHLSNDDGPSTAFADPKLSSLKGGVVQRAYARYQAGNDEFENDAYGGGYVLRHTTNAPARWTANIADFNVGAVYSTAHLLSEVSSSQLWVFPCPARLRSKIANIPVLTPREYFGWGWKKGRSNEETTANNRVNIVQSYTLEQWSTDDYPVY